MLVSTLLFISALALIVLTQPQGKHVTISERAISRRWSSILFTTTLTLFGSSFVLYMYRYFGPQFGLPAIYYPALAIGWLGLLGVAWTPAEPGKKNAHWVAAYGAAAMMTVMMLALAFAHSVGDITRIFAILIGIWYCYSLYVLLYVQTVAKNIVVYQAVNILSFFSVFIGVSFLK